MAVRSGMMEREPRGTNCATRQRGYDSHCSPVCSHSCLLRNPGPSIAPWSGSHRTRPSRIFLFFPWIYSFCTPHQPSYPVFDLTSISTVSNHLCSSPAHIQSLADWVFNFKLSFDDFGAISLFGYVYPLCGTTDRAASKRF